MVGAQLGRTTYILVFDKQGYIHAQLADSWQRAAPDLLDHLESRYQCDGFDACSPILARAFGETIYAWGLALWMLKFVQVQCGMVPGFKLELALTVYLSFTRLFRWLGCLDVTLSFCTLIKNLPICRKTLKKVKNPITPSHSKILYSHNVHFVFHLF